MSQETVEIVRRYVEVWNAGDMEGVRELLDPGAVMVVVPNWPEPGPFVGRDAVMDHLSKARGAFDSDWLELLSDPRTVDDRVIVRTGWHGVGLGPVSDMEWSTVFTIGDGRILKMQFLWDHAEALEAVGLSD
jgi:ketosteroid isomerase-like protein